MKLLHDRRELQAFGFTGFFIGLGFDLMMSTNLVGDCVMGMALACHVIAMFLGKDS